MHDISYSVRYLRPRVKINNRSNYKVRAPPCLAKFRAKIHEMLYCLSALVLNSVIVLCIDCVRKSGHRLLSLTIKAYRNNCFYVHCTQSSEFGRTETVVLLLTVSMATRYWSTGDSLPGLLETEICNTHGTWLCRLWRSEFFRVSRSGCMLLLEPSWQRSRQLTATMTREEVSEVAVSWHIANFDLWRRRLMNVSVKNCQFLQSQQRIVI